jgi:hypothetical protein
MTASSRAPRAEPRWSDFVPEAVADLAYSASPVMTVVPLSKLS